MENLNNTNKTSENVEKELRISDVMYRFKKWWKKPLSRNDVIIMYISWLIGIIYLIFCK